MIKRFIVCASILAALAFSGCAMPSSSSDNTRTVYLQNSYNAAYAKSQLLAGPNTIRGNAFLRKRNGDVVTAAGSTVYLTPVTLYATERIQAIYGNTTRAYVSEENDRPTKFVPDLPEYLENERRTVADADGRFRFTALKDGDFYVCTNVHWTYIDNGRSRKTGGYLMQRVTVAHGVVQDIVMSQ